MASEKNKWPGTVFSRHLNGLIRNLNSFTEQVKKAFKKGPF